MNKITEFAIEKLTAAGAEKAQVAFYDGKTIEINVAENKITLMRTIFNYSVSLTAIINGKKGSISVNDISEETIAEAAATVCDMARGSQEDPANDIAALEEGTTVFKRGIKEVSEDKLYMRIAELLERIETKYPSILLEGHASYHTSDGFWQNTNGVHFTTTDGTYNFSFDFSAKENGIVSSMNGAGAVTLDIDKPFWEQGGLDTILADTVASIHAKPFTGKYTGDIVMSPDCAGGFLGMYMGFVGDYALISGTSPFKDKLGEKIAHESLTVKSEPTRRDICGGDLTGDGFRAKDITIIENGVLKTFLLSQYGANKTGFTRAGNGGGYRQYVTGEVNHEDIIKGIKKGILVGRFSGGAPSDNGDFSGVAKNSFYIEDGKITHPVTEAMINGNLVDMFNNIRNISSDTVFDGRIYSPWVHVDGITVSGSAT